MTMGGLVGKKGLSQADWIFKDAYLSEDVQAIAQESVAISREVYRKSAAAAQGGDRCRRNLLFETDDVPWLSTEFAGPERRAGLERHEADSGGECAPGFVLRRQ